MTYAADILILAALILLAIGVGLIFGAAIGCLVGAGGCLVLGIIVGVRGGDA